MNKLSLAFCFFLLTVGLQGFAHGQTYFVSSEKKGILLEMWAESPEPNWNSLSVCCAITNLRSQPYYVETDTAVGIPALYLSMVDHAGGKVAARETRNADRLFMEPGHSPYGALGRRLFAGESMIVRVRPQLHFDLPNPSGAKLKAIWNNQFSDAVTPSTLTLTLGLPEKPLVIKRGSPSRREFTAGELAARDDRANDGLPPLPPAPVPTDATQAQSNVKAAASPGASSTAFTPEKMDAGNQPPIAPKESSPKQPALSQEPTSSTSWAILGVLIVAATGLMWWLLKNRK